MKNYSADMILMINWQWICLALNDHISGVFSRVGSENGQGKHSRLGSDMEN